MAYSVVWRKIKAKRRTKLDEQESIAFQYRECLESFIKDLRNLDKLIPAESSRSAYGLKDIEAKCIIEHRKNRLLNYMQTVIRDHIHWGQALLDKGWTVDQHKRSKRK